MQKTCLLVLLVAFISSSSYAGTDAKTCTSVDLRGEKLGPVRNQDSMGACYAFSSADLLSYKMGHKISAMSLMRSKAKTWYLSILDKLSLQSRHGQLMSGGNEKPLLDQALKTGLCLEKDLPSEDNLNVEYRDRIEALFKLKSSVEKKEVTHYDACIQLLTLFPAIEPNDAIAILINSDLNSLFDRLAEKSCDRKIKAPSLKIASEKKIFLLDKLFPTDLFSTINRELSRKNPPIIGYVGKVLVDIETKKTNISHSSLIVGRKFNPASQTCEYLVRNSWGRSCSYYDSRLKCEEGHIWLPENILGKKLNEVVYAK